MQKIWHPKTCGDKIFTNKITSNSWWDGAHEQFQTLQTEINAKADKECDMICNKQDCSRSIVEQGADVSKQYSNAKDWKNNAKRSSSWCDKKSKKNLWAII